MKRVLILGCIVVLSAFTYKHDNVLPDSDDGVLRILAIGNSFSQDAVEHYLYGLFKDSGKEVIIGNLYIGGCSLERHYNNINSDAAAYEYRKIVDGIRTNRENVKISEAVAEEDWDYISIQQVSGLSGKLETCTPYLQDILDYVRSIAPSDAKLVWHSTWAYPSSSGHGDFPRYGSDQMTMFNAIVDVAKSMMSNASYGFDVLVPSGTAVQNGRTSSLGDSFDRDGFHLNTTYGCYTAACAWYEAISGNNVEDNAYTPSAVSVKEAEIARKAAHNAVANPYSVTSLSAF